jgi:RNA polymerase sigma-70 factor, ECF subfamily
VGAIVRTTTDQPSSAARSGKPGALAQLMQHIRPWLVQHAAACADHPAHGGIQDTVQDACERVLRDLPYYRGRSTHDFHAWLTAITRRAVVHHSTLLDHDQHHPTSELPDTPDLYDGPEEHALRRDDHALLRAAMTYLTRQEQTLLELRLAHGVPVAEVTARYGRTSNSVRVTQTRALRRLRYLLAAIQDGTLPASTTSVPQTFAPLSATVFTGHPYAALPRPTECSRCHATITVHCQQCEWCGHITATMDPPAVTSGSDSAVA